MGDIVEEVLPYLPLMIGGVAAAALAFAASVVAPLVGLEIATITTAANVGMFLCGGSFIGATSSMYADG